LSEDLYRAVSEWASHEGYSPAERIALQYVEKFAVDHTSLDAAFFDRMREHFSDEEILEISICIGTWLSLGRVTQVMDVSVSCPIQLELGDSAEDGDRPGAAAATPGA